jgi:micrococcal nuclease
MKKNTIFWLLLLAPFAGFSQSVKTNLYDKFLKKQRVETEALAFSGLTGKNKLSFSYTALGSAIYLTLNGAGWGTTTVDVGDELSLLFSNDSVLSLRSEALQSFEPGTLQNTYRHQYVVSLKQLEKLSQFDVVSIRKYSFKTFSDMKVPAGNAEKLKQLSALFAGELKKANIFKSLQQISVKEIPVHIGDSVQFCTRVYKTRFFEESADQPTVLDIQANFSDPVVNVVIAGKDREQFSGAPEKKFLNKDVCITGVVTLHNNIPQINVVSRDQIRVNNPVALSELELFVGDSITVAGKVFTARFFEESKTKPTLLNVGAPYPDQPLTLVIENEDRSNFAKPEEHYLNKTLQVSGVVQVFKGKPQIVLRRPQQVQVVDSEATSVAFAAVKESDSTTQTSQNNSAHQAKTAAEKEAPVVEASFPGGHEAFGAYLRQRLMIPGLLQGNEQKRLLVLFDIDATGSCTNVFFKESAGEVFDKEVKKVLLAMPKWKPANRNGEPLSITVTLPLSLNGGDVNLQRKP